jgi:predicted metal-dependent HD superfamily phosphohydrolase
MTPDQRLEKVISYARDNMPKKDYHNFEHAQKVAEAFRKIGYLEALTETEINLGEVSAYLHDIIHQNAPDDETRSAERVQEVLPQWGYSAKEVQTVTELIRATKFPTSPKNLLEQVMCDADIFYLGTEEYWQGSEQLRQEWNIEYGTWNARQVVFIENVRYYTESARELTKLFLQRHLQKLKEVK